MTPEGRERAIALMALDIGAVNADLARKHPERLLDAVFMLVDKVCPGETPNDWQTKVIADRDAVVAHIVKRAEEDRDEALAVIVAARALLKTKVSDHTKLVDGRAFEVLARCLDKLAK